MSEAAFDKERFDANLRLAQLGFDLWDKRRALEWRVTFGLWSLIAGAIFLRDLKVPLWFGPILLCGYIYFWLFSAWKSNERSRAFGRFYLTSAQRVLSDDCKPLAIVGEGREKALAGFVRDWAMQFQAISTCVLVAVLYVVKGW
jgi:hypothetical protein